MFIDEGISGMPIVRADQLEVGDIIPLGNDANESVALAEVTGIADDHGDTVMITFYDLYRDDRSYFRMSASLSVLVFA